MDRCDQLMSFYRNKLKSTKWYRRVFYHFMDLTMINSYILRKEMLGNIKLFQFKLNVALSLMYGENFENPMSRSALVLRSNIHIAENGDPVGSAKPVDAVRLDGSNHFPENVAAVPRMCKVKDCKKRSVFWCTKCKVYLCLNKDRNCFLNYHTVE